MTTVQTELQSPETLVRNSTLGKIIIKSALSLILLLELLVFCDDDVPISLQVLTSAGSCIIIGSFWSLRHPDSADAQEIEKMKPKDAYMFPVMGSCVLLTFYCCIKYLPAFMFDYASQAFFAVISVFGVQGLIESLVSMFLAPSSILTKSIFVVHVKYKLLFTVSIRNKNKPIYLPIVSCGCGGRLGQGQGQGQQTPTPTPTPIHSLNVISILFGAVVALFWFLLDGHWLPNNIIGISISIQAVSFINPGSFYTAALLLFLLFFYDVFWVFFTPVMVSVAKKLKAPIKLMFPRPAVSPRPNMLGLGDIVLPGIYLALLLRYDVKRLFNRNRNRNRNFNEHYSVTLANLSTFLFALICYLISLGTTLFSMYYFDHAQPALLYIVPALLIPVFIFTFIRGDFSNLWTYDETKTKTKVAVA